LSLPLRPQFEPDSELDRFLQRGSKLLAWLRLMRLPNVFTAIADVAMGYLFVERSIADPSSLALLVGASAALYTAGMVLNDVFDLPVDRLERAFRPLPSGKIRVAAAAALGWALLAFGVALGGLAGYLPGTNAALPWRSGAVAVALAGAIVLYDRWPKRTPLGPLAMGTCRFLNVLLGMSVAAQPAGGMAIGYGAGELLAAAGIGVYVVGITWFARSEAGRSSSLQLAAAMLVMAAGAVLLGSSATQVRLRIDREIYWMLLGLLMVTVLRRCAAAAMDPAPQKVQAGVKHAILSLIWLDAATTIAMASPAHGIAIAALLVPALLLGRWVYST
jgi:4-hydroxybenzoate polyprenyltransferase